jgi:hypothetical protein
MHRKTHIERTRGTRQSQISRSVVATPTVDGAA